MKLAGVFCDHAVLQRGISIPVWGWTQPRVRVSVCMAGAGAETLAGADGRFLARLPPMPAGGPFTLEVRAGGERVAVRDVWVGEVWVCSGQSNMEWVLSQCNRPQDVTEATFPGLRVFTVPRLALAGRQSDVTGAWQPATPATAGAFSAVGYHFGLRLHQQLGVAVGLINTSWGGTRIEAWTSREALMLNVDTATEVQRSEASWHAPSFWERFGDADITDPSVRAALRSPAMPPDPGNGGEADGWAEKAATDEWESIDLPRTWQSAGHPGSGVYWFRREIDVPAAWSGRDLLLGIGAVDKHDVTYFNGQRVGATGKDFEQNHWCVPRTYRVPGKLVRKGRNTIAVRAYSFAYDGGMIGPVTAMNVRPAEGSDAPLPLAGPWKMRREHDFGVVAIPPDFAGPGNPNSIGILYDNMIAPLVPYGIAGAIWYQGESNCGLVAPRYRRMLADMIRDWRRAWGQGDFDFLTVQLANYMPAREFQENSTWAIVREAELQSLQLPNTGLAVTIDIGEANDIHPRNKRDVGLRLAAWALSKRYRRPGAASGPIYSGMTIEGRRVRIRFDHVGSGLTSGGGGLRTFVIAGSDRRFVTAQAEIDGETVVVSSPEVAEPMAVRYAWADNPEGCNLHNAEGLPASPFRTDTW